MLRILRKLLWPLGLLYGMITSVRNFLYDRGILKSYSFEVPIIAVGNLSVGGTGKSPMVEYLIRMLQSDYKIATLSRGYRRKSTGFVLADASSTADILGDEPFQFHRKFPNVSVAVDADRKRGIENLLKTVNPDIIILDDAFQHRRVKAGFYILLTSYDNIYPDDMMLPAGNLREPAWGADRADLIVVTKCPSNLSESEKQKIIGKLGPKKNQSVFFSSIAYDEKLTNGESSILVDEIRKKRKTLVAGIAKPLPFFDFLRTEGDTVLEFPDHHDFTDGDIAKISAAANDFPVVTTEKDFVRLTGHLPRHQLYYLPIRTDIENGSGFDKIVQNYVGKSTGNR